ncbi:MAG: hypothetical protein HY092_04360 [Candidatus Kerfeldbacteria bacterium]|nr:hypothetical protein [Candidatus Kerfeldbacteria bacterium]
MPEQALTQSYFDTTMTKLFGVVATKDDLRPIIHDLRETRDQLRQLTDSVDGLTQLHTKDHDELILLRARTDRMAYILVHKGVATEQELRP